MNKNLVTACISVVFTLAYLFAPASTRAEGPSTACALYTKADAEGLLKQTVADGVPHKTVMPAGDSCRYTYTKNGDSYSLKLRVSSSDEIKKEGIQDSAADVIKRQENTRMNSPYAAKKFKKIPNLGTNAFWGGEDLWVLKDDTLLIISVHSFLSGSFQNMEAMREAREHQDQTLSLQVAKTILARLN